MVGGHNSLVVNIIVPQYKNRMFSYKKNKKKVISVLL